MENNNQMNQFFTEQQNVQTPEQQTQPEFSKPVQPQYEQHTQINNQPAQTQPQFSQPVQTQYAQYQQPMFMGFPNMNQTFVSDEITPEMRKKFTRASNVALVGGVILILVTIVRIIIDFIILSEVNNAIALLKQIAERNGEEISSISESQIDFQIAIVLGFIVLIVAILFTVLAFFVRKSKQKAIAINLIVFSGIFIAILFIGLIFVLSSISDLNAQIVNFEKLLVKLSGKDLLDAKAVVVNFKNILGQIFVLIGVSIMSIIGWFCMLTGGILRVSVKDNKPVIKW